MPCNSRAKLEENRSFLWWVAPFLSSLGAVAFLETKEWAIQTAIGDYTKVTKVLQMAWK